MDDGHASPKPETSSAKMRAAIGAGTWTMPSDLCKGTLAAESCLTPPESRDQMPPINEEVTKIVA